MSSKSSLYSIIVMTKQNSFIAQTPLFRYYTQHMNLISIENVSKTVKDQPLFSEITLGIHAGERIGLIGKNGTGKSTFLRVLFGDLESDSGTIAKNRELRLSMLEQVPKVVEGSTISSFLYEDKSYKITVLNDYRACVEAYEHDQSKERALAELTELMDEEACWEIEHEYLSRLTELGITEIDRPMKELSGGMIKKVALARAVATGPNLIILDEPTNHLDIKTIEWLEEYLISSQMGCIMVTHDRYILDAVCSKILEIDDETIYTYEGNYSVFLERRAQRIQEQNRYQDKITNILRKEREWLLRGAKARTTKNKSRIQKVYDLMDQKTEVVQKDMEFSSTHRRLGKKVLELKKIEKWYGAHHVVAPFSYSFKRGERIGILGPNGSGKTTFLDMITGRAEITSGEVEMGINTHIAYYDQLSRPLKENLTVLEYMEELAEMVTVQPGVRISVSQFLERFNFPSSSHRIQIGRLSGGEKRRLYLISLLMQHPNFLVLDEPTNDLDIDTLRALEDYVEEFDGCLLVVSHDRAFLDRVTDYLFVFDGTGAVLGVSGSYSDYQLYQKALEEQKKEPVIKKQKRVQREVKKRLSFKEKKEYESIETFIDTLETEKSEIEASFCLPDIDPDKMRALHQRYQEVEIELESKIERWEYLAERDI